MRKVTPDAEAAESRRSGSDRWVDSVRRRPRRLHRAVDTGALIDDVRDEFGVRSRRDP